MPIDTLANVKLMLGVTGTDDDALLDSLRSAADEFVPRFCGRGFCGGSFTEDHAGGGRTVFLRNYPVGAVGSVKVDPQRAFGAGTELDPARYVVHADRGVVESVAGRFGPGGSPGAVRVAYDTPAGAVPAAVCRAYAELVGHWYRQAKTAVALGQKNVTMTCEEGSSMQTAYPWGQSGGFKVPEGVLDLLRPYRDPAV